MNAIQAIDTSGLVKKANYNTKINEIEKTTPSHDKYTQVFNRSTAESVAARLKQTKLRTKDMILIIL